MNQIKLATYNIRNGIHSKTIVSNLKRIERQGAQIFCIQELRKFKNKKFVGDEIEKAFGEDWKIKYFIKPESKDIGLAIMWRPSCMELSGLEKLYLPKIKHLNAGVKMLEPIFFKRSLPTQRGALIADFKILQNNKRLRVVNVHLDWMGGEHKVMQLNYCVSCLKLRPEVDAEIVCGDFNTVGPLGFFKKRREEIIKILGPQFTNILQKTHMTSRSYQLLDYIFVKGLEPVGSKVLKWRGSDHWPVFAAFGLPAGKQSLP